MKCKAEAVMLSSLPGTTTRLNILDLYIDNGDVCIQIRFLVETFPALSTQLRSPFFSVEVFYMSFQRIRVLKSLITRPTISYEIVLSNFVYFLATEVFFFYFLERFFFSCFCTKYFSMHQIIDCFKVKVNDVKVGNG